MPDNVRQVHLVGRKIRELRKERRLTQVELSSRLGIQQSDLCRMEKGEYRVSLDTLFRILAEFKMSIGDFFEAAPAEPVNVSPERGLAAGATGIASGTGPVNGAAASGAEGAAAARWMQDFKTLPADAQREVEEFIAFKRQASERMASVGTEES
jgi:transcriptional regulator with XRE-family HTH domain